MRVKTYFLACFISCLPLQAHEDPHDVIHVLTHQIEATKDKKKLSELHLKRFFEHMAINKRKLALHDVQQSCHFDPENFRARLEYGKFIQGPLAMVTLQDALKLAKSDIQKRDAHYAISVNYYGYKGHRDLGNASLSCDKAIAHDKENDLSLVMLKSHILWKLEKLDERVEFLFKATKKNPSVVLRNAWIDAMIDAGKGAIVKKLITEEKNDSRFKSSWLIRAALCEPEDSKAAKVYAQAAITEIKTRLNLDRPDVTLLMDLARAYAIVGEQDKAEVYADRAKQLSHDEWAMDELEAKIK